MNKKTSVIGCGRLGICLSLLAERSGYNVVCVDNNESYVETLKNKTFKTSEPQIEEYLRDAKNINFSIKVSDALIHSDLIFCLVATPSKDDHSYNHQYIEEVVKSIYSYYENGGDVSGKTLVVTATCMPKYTASLHDRLSNIGMSVIYSPVMIAQGSVIKDLVNADVVLIGGNEIPDSLYEFYESIMSKKPDFKVMSHTGIELVKIATNCFLSLKIAFANSIGDICIESGLTENETNNVLDAIGSDSRVGSKYFGYGLPASGVCLPRDVRALSFYIDNYTSVFNDLLLGLGAANEWHMDYVKNKIIIKNPDKTIPIEINQLSYKPNVPIITESRELQLCEMLLREGYLVNITESEDVIQQAKPILEKFGDKVKYIVRENG